MFSVICRSRASSSCLPTPTTFAPPSLLLPWPPALQQQQPTAPVVDAECLAYVAPAHCSSCSLAGWLPKPSARACFCLTRGVRSVRVCLVGLSLGALVLSRALACWSCASLLTLLACEICAPGSVLPAPCVVCPGLVRGSGEAIYRATCVRPPALKSEKQGVMNLSFDW